MGEENEGLRVAFHGLNPGPAFSLRQSQYRPLRHCESRGVCQGSRGVVGTDRLPPGDRSPLAEGKIKLDLAQLMMQRAAGLYDAGLGAGEASDVAKLAAAEAEYSAWTEPSRPWRQSVSREYRLALLLVPGSSPTRCAVSREMISTT